MTYTEATLERFKKSEELASEVLKNATTHPQVEEVLLINIDATLKSIALNTAAIADELRKLNEREGKA